MAILLVRGFPFYGYYNQQFYFLKICLLSPFVLTKAADLLQSGACMGTHFQPYESHLPYHLQFLLDYNLYGMDYVEIRKYSLRTTGTELLNRQLQTKMFYVLLVFLEFTQDVFALSLIILDARSFIHQSDW